MTALFGAALALPLLTASLERWDGLRERRTANPPPTAPRSWRDLAAWPGAAEAYLADHFGGRAALAAAHAAIETSLFRSPPVTGVAFGPNGWLFYMPRQSIADFAGRRVLSDAGIADFVGSLRDKHDSLAKLGVHYYFMVAPNKESLYPEETPHTLVQGSVHEVDRLLAYFEAHGGRPDWFIDPRPALRMHRTPLPVYHPLDVHWNDYGAFLAYAEAARLWQRDLPGFAEVVRRRADFAPLLTYSGDLFGMATRTSHREKPLLSAADVGRRLPCTAMAPADTALLPRHTEPDQAAICPGAAGDHRAVVFHDSMIFAMQPYLRQSFAKTIFVWQYPDRAETVHYAETLNADVVLEERVERVIPDGERPSIELTRAPAIDAASRGGEFAVSHPSASRYVVRGWAMWRSGKPGLRLRLATNLPVRRAHLVRAQSMDVALARHDQRLAEVGFYLQLDLQTAAPLPAAPRLCLGSSDPVLGDYRLKATGPTGFDTCALP